MGHGWPQGFAVAIMRRVRPDLEREHARILRQGPFDPEAIRAAARPRVISADNTDPVYLTLASKAQRESDERQVGEAHPTSWACVRRVLAPTSRAAHHGQKIHGPLPVRLRRAPSLIRGRWSLFSTVRNSITAGSLKRIEDLDTPLLVCEPVLAEAMHLLARFNSYPMH
jgi:hypothetical protein